MDVHKVSMTVPVSAEQAADMEGMQQLMSCSFFLMTFGSASSLTDDEARTGWRIVPHEDHEHQVAVGWRREQENREYQAKREAEMAACPYVACTCGHHED